MIRNLLEDIIFVRILKVQRKCEMERRHLAPLKEKLNETKIHHNNIITEQLDLFLSGHESVKNMIYMDKESEEIRATIKDKIFAYEGKLRKKGDKGAKRTTGESNLTKPMIIVLNKGLLEWLATNNVVVGIPVLPRTSANKPLHLFCHGRLLELKKKREEEISKIARISIVMTRVGRVIKPKNKD